MREEILRDYFEDLTTVDQLKQDLKNSEEKTSYDVTSVFVDQIKDGSSYLITNRHLIKLCQDAIAGNLNIEALSTISFALIASEYFKWDDDIVDTVIYGWESPEINHPLTVDNLRLWERYLNTGKYDFN